MYKMSFVLVTYTAANPSVLYGLKETFNQYSINNVIFPPHVYLQFYLYCQ